MIRLFKWTLATIYFLGASAGLGAMWWWMTFEAYNSPKVAFDRGDWTACIGFAGFDILFGALFIAIIFCPPIEIIKSFGKETK